MTLGIAVILILITFIILKSIVSLSLKIVGISVLTAAIVFTLWICAVQPDMHKPFSLSTIEYLFKINKDGSVTTTKQVTQTVIKQNGENGGKN